MKTSLDSALVHLKGSGGQEMIENMRGNRAWDSDLPACLASFMHQFERLFSIVILETLRHVVCVCTAVCQHQSSNNHRTEK